MSVPCDNGKGAIREDRNFVLGISAGIKYNQSYL